LLVVMHGGLLWIGYGMRFQYRHHAQFLPANSRWRRFGRSISLTASHSGPL
jgi:hypothetical protein